MQGCGDGGDAFRLVVAILAFDDADGRPLDMVAPQLLLVNVRVVRDEMVGRAQDALRAAVVLFELDDLQLRVIAAELVDVLGVGAAPGVDALVVVAHAGEARLGAGDGLEQAVLRVVGVLVFVHQQVAKALLPDRPCVGIGFQDAQRQADQVVEVHRVECREALLVEIVDRGGLDLARRARGGHGFFRRETRVLRLAQQVADAHDHLGLHALGRQLLDHVGAVLGVQHREAATQLRALVLDLQEFQAQRVERAHGERAGRVVGDELADALAHLLRGLVGEGDRSDLLRGEVPPGDQVRDLLRDDAGLAGAGAGQHEEGTVAVFDGRVLLGVEHRIGRDASGGRGRGW